jgi:hypothetical protein
LQQITNFFTAHGSSLAQAHDQAIQWIGQQMRAQASFLAYMDAFWVLMLISLSAVPRWGQSRWLRDVQVTSALPSIAAVSRTSLTFLGSFALTSVDEAIVKLE